MFIKIKTPTEIGIHKTSDVLCITPRIRKLAKMDNPDEMEDICVIMVESELNGIVYYPVASIEEASSIIDALVLPL